MARSSATVSPPSLTTAQPDLGVWVTISSSPARATLSPSTVIVTEPAERNEAATSAASHAPIAAATATVLGDQRTLARRPALWPAAGGCGPTMRREPYGRVPPVAWLAPSARRVAGRWPPGPVSATALGAPTLAHPGR